MKKMFTIFCAASTFLLLSCNVNYSNLNRSTGYVQSMKNIRTNTTERLYNTIISFKNDSLKNSEIFKNISSCARSAEEKFDYLTDEEELSAILTMSEEEIKEIKSIITEYMEQIEEIVSVPIFNPKNMPDGVYETDMEVYIGDYCYLKTIPEDYETVTNLAKQYYSENSRGAVLHALVGTMTFDGWPEGIVYYGFDNFPEDQKIIVQQCMAEWSEKTNNVVVFKNKGNFNWWSRAKWYLGLYRVLRIQNKALEGGTLGTTTPGKIWAPYMNFDVSKLNTYSHYKMHTYRHEIGHALGLQHEFDRFDRDDYVTLYDPSNTSWEDISVNAFCRFFITSYNTYDYNSVMNYSDFYCIKNPDGSKGKVINMSDIENISEGDVDVIKKIYMLR